MRTLQIALLAAVMLVMAINIGRGQQQPMGKITYAGTDYFGLPLGFDGKNIAMLGPTGQLKFVPAESEKDLTIVSKKFKSYSPQQIRQLLLKEFGDRYDVSTTERFVVVHPWGSPLSYARPFEMLHDRFTDLIQSHGIKLGTPPVPLVAVVLRSRNDFDRYLLKEVQIKDPNVQGYYSPISNRITTFDPSGYLRTKNDDWIFSSQPIIHEAIHQSAFNTGLHNRFASPPKWITEGLATLFEAKGINNPQKFPSRADRINDRLLKHLRKKINEGDLYTLLLNIIDNDRLFETDIETAYALSWGLSFYLHEAAPKRFFQFIHTDAKRKNFSGYGNNQRLKNFAKAYGNDFEKLTKRLTNFYVGKQE